MKINRTKMADFFGVSRTTITDWERKGAPVRSGDPSAVAKWYVASRPTVSVSGERALLLKVQTRRAELELREREGELHRTDDCRKATFDCARALRDRILMVPDRISSVIAAESDMRIIHRTLTDELTVALTEFADSPVTRTGERSTDRSPGKDHPDL